MKLETIYDKEAKELLAELAIYMKLKQKELDEIFFKKYISFIYDALELISNNKNHIFLKNGFYLLEDIQDRSILGLLGLYVLSPNSVISKIIALKDKDLYLTEDGGSHMLLCSRALDDKRASDLPKGAYIPTVLGEGDYLRSITFLEFLNEFEAQIIYYYITTK